MSFKSDRKATLNQNQAFTLQQKKVLRGDLDDGAFAKSFVTGAGTGITTGTGTVIKQWIEEDAGIVKTQIFIDVTGLNSAATGDIIGVNAAANCHLGQINSAESGTLMGGSVTCVEAPATGDTDIDLYSATESTGTEDAAVTGLTETALLAAGGAWTSGAVKGLTALPAAGEYLYLTSGGAGADATYTAGKFLITLFGYR